MPTKPITQPEAWATNAVYTTGPFVGSPSSVVPPLGVAAEGHRPGALFPTAAEHENSQQGTITALVRWLFLGTANPDPDAHVVETNAAGYAGLFGLTVNNSLDGPPAVTVDSVNTIVPAMQITCVTGAAGLQSDIGTSGGDALAGIVNAGTGSALAAVLSGTLAGGSGLRVSADAATTADGILVAHGGTGRGVVVTHTGASGVALEVTGNAGSTALTVQAGGNATGVISQGSGGGAGVLGLSGAVDGASGVIGASSNATGAAVLGATPGYATTAASAVYGDAYGSAAGVRGKGVLHAGGVFSATQPGGVALLLPGKTADPTNVFGGRIDFNTTTGTFVVSDPGSLSYFDVHASRGGAVMGAATGGTGSTIGGSWITVQTLTLSGTNSPRRAGCKILIRCSLCPRQLGAMAGNVIDVQLHDTTAGADLVTRSGVGIGATAGYYFGAAVSDWQVPISFEYAYTVPLAGARTFVLRIDSNYMTQWTVRDASISVFGAWT